MSATRDFDHIVIAWLDQMPDRVSDRVIADVLQVVETTPQMRRWFGGRPRRPELMNRLILVAAIAALGVVLLGGAAIYIGGRPGLAPPPTATASPLPTESSATPSSPPASTAAVSSNSPSPVASTPTPTDAIGGSVSTQLQARWMSSARPSTHDTAGVSLRLDAATFEMAQSNSNGEPYASGVAGSPADGELAVGNSGSFGCASSATGTYRWTLSDSGRVLTLTLNNDACERRAADMAGTYWLMGCTDPGTNCLGELDPGTYGSQYIRPLSVPQWGPLFGGISYTVDDGWANYADWPTTFGLTTSEDFANTTPEGPDPVFSVDVMTDARALAAPCSDAPSDSELSARELMLNLPSNVGSAIPTGFAGEPPSVTIGSYPGYLMDIEPAAASPGRSGRGGDCVNGGTYFYAGGASQDIGAGERQRLILLDLPDGSVLAIRVNSDSERFEQLSAAAMPVIESMTFK